LLYERASALISISPQVLEHHFSIAYGRPPIIHEDTCITKHETFLNTASVEQRDVRLHSQIALFIILTRIYHAFGPDVDLEVLEHELPKIEDFDHDIETWQQKWTPRLCELIFFLMDDTTKIRADCI
jgi:hypothetical protein